jgi:hypothetical protein
MAVALVERMVTHFEKVTDPRANRGRNDPLIEMVFVALCGAICDCNTWTDVADFGEAKLAWFRKFLPFEQGIPAHDTFTEVFARLDTIEFYAALESWAGELAGALRGETVAIDGKTRRGSFDAAAGQSALHSVSAWACGLKLCLKLQSAAGRSTASGWHSIFCNETLREKEAPAANAAAGTRRCLSNSSPVFPRYSTRLL